MKATMQLEVNMSHRELDTTAFSSLLKAELNAVAPRASVWARLAPRMTKPAPRRAWRWTLSAALAGAALVLATGAAFAVSSLTGHIVIDRVPSAVSGPGKVLPNSIKAPFRTTLADAQQRAGFTALPLAVDDRPTLRQILYPPSANNPQRPTNLASQF